jgi:hypothetical protein
MAKLHNALSNESVIAPAALSFRAQLCPAGLPRDAHLWRAVWCEVAQDVPQVTWLRLSSSANPRSWFLRLYCPESPVARLYGPQDSGTIFCSKKRSNLAGGSGFSKVWIRPLTESLMGRPDELEIGNSPLDPVTSCSSAILR